MNRLARTILFAALIAGSLHDSAVAQTSGRNSPSIGTVKGNATFNYQPAAKYFSQQKMEQSTNVSVVVRAADTGKLNALQRHQDALLLAQNPTNVELAEAKFGRWLRDDEEFVSIVFRNTSGLPANHFKFGIPDPKRKANGSKGMRFLKVQQSNSQQLDIAHYRIEAGKDRFVPLLSVAELHKLLGLRPEQCIVLAGLPEALRKFPSLPHKPGITNSAIYSLPVGFTYRTIFDQDVSTVAQVSIVVTERGQLLPQQSDDDSAIRCHDPRALNAGAQDAAPSGAD